MRELPLGLAMVMSGNDECLAMFRLRTEKGWGKHRELRLREIEIDCRENICVFVFDC